MPPATKLENSEVACKLSEPWRLIPRFCLFSSSAFDFTFYLVILFDLAALSFYTWLFNGGLQAPMDKKKLGAKLCTKCLCCLLQSTTFFWGVLLDATEVCQLPLRFWRDGRGGRCVQAAANWFGWRVVLGGHFDVWLFQQWTSGQPQSVAGFCGSLQNEKW